MPKDKKELITFLSVVLRNFVVVHIALNRFKKDPRLPKNVIFDTGSKKVELPIKSLFTSTETGEFISLKEVLGNCTKSQSRAILAETFELIKGYCETTDQLGVYKSWNAYNFSRLLRHMTSHGVGGRLNQWPPELKKKGIVKVSWRERIIDESMVGQRIGMTDPEIVALTKDQIDFVEKSLA